MQPGSFALNLQCCCKAAAWIFNPHISISGEPMYLASGTNKVAIQASPVNKPGCQNWKINVQLHARGPVNADPCLPREALPQQSGYLPINGTSTSKLFFAYYEATEPLMPVADTPWLLWLNGGPGCSSLIGCFYEIGPWHILEDLSLQRNDGAWNRRCGILFIDSPVGTGFSVASSEDEMPKDQETVAKHLDYALNHFVKVNPIFRSRPLFLAGESYAGKYVPALAHYTLCQPGNSRTYLVGILIGNGFTDPRTQVQAHADVLSSLSLLDRQQIQYVRETAAIIVNLVDREEWVQAHEKRNSLCDWMEFTSGIATTLDIRRSCKYHHLEDTMKSVKWKVEAVLEKGLPVLLYQGIYDAKDGPAGSERWMRSLAWPGAQAFWESERRLWRENGKLVGYTRSMANLAHVVFVGAGHQVPADQPAFSQMMFERWMNSLLDHHHQFPKL